MIFLKDKSHCILHLLSTHIRKICSLCTSKLTSLPLKYRVYQGPISPDEFDASETNRKVVQPGSSIPIYINDTLEEQLIHAKPANFSNRLFDQKANGVCNQYITIQLDGTSVPSDPISMDLVGLAYSEGYLSMSYNDHMENHRTKANAGFVVPVVFDVSVLQYSKLIRLYSKVILSNATSVPLELRFDIPFGVSPKIWDPIYPGQELPMPLTWQKPVGLDGVQLEILISGVKFITSEAYNLSNLLSQESKIKFLKSFGCYSAHPNSDPFHCCISVRNISLPSSVRSREIFSSHLKSSLKQAVASSG
ncbi:putative vacuolar protein sorting-associated protein [Rosa chinensis]|uniref:Putative vacuolar protein sorting-associated protein n=1 Tax=Rosa chinensis TaxID=74649 RepID=A0A2P6QFD7_ROSCH|nr:putative vacuolar protein sorting-associated protein [Rosa chinensis]